MMILRRNVAVSCPSKGRGRPCKRQKITTEVSPVSVADAPSFTVPEYTVAEFSQIKNPEKRMVLDLNAPTGITRKTVWITDGSQYYALQTHWGASKTDTENRSLISVESCYIQLYEYQEPERYLLIAKVRLSDIGARPELMSVNAGGATSGEKVLALVHDLIEVPFKVPGYTLHDAAYCRHKKNQFSIRKLRGLAGMSQPSIYERTGFGLVSCYQQSVGQYASHTQIPVLADLAGRHVRKQRLDHMIETFLPLIKAPFFGDKITGKMEKSIRRWCPNPAVETVQDLFQKLLTASKYFKKTEDPLSVNGLPVSKALFYSDLNLLLNVMMSEVYTDEDSKLIRDTFEPFYDRPGSGRWAFMLQCAMDCVGSHIVYEKPNGADYVPLSQDVASTAFAGTDSFSKAVVQLTDVLPLTWAELCRSERVGALFS